MKAAQKTISQDEHEYMPAAADIWFIASIVLMIGPMVIVSLLSLISIPALIFVGEATIQNSVNAIMPWFLGISLVGMASYLPCLLLYGSPE